MDLNTILLVVVSLLIIVLYKTKKFFSGGMCGVSRDLKGQVVVITGCNTGIGKETARVLASKNATLVLANRSEQRTAPLLKELYGRYPSLSIQYIPLDLSDFESIKKFATEFNKKYERLDILLNNAGVMLIPERQMTKQNLEMQIGTNHFGHFLLTALLFPTIKKTDESRIINVSSKAHRRGGPCTIDFNDLQCEKEYKSLLQYAKAKLSNILFTKELQRRIQKNNLNIKVVTLHPGAVNTELSRFIINKWWKKALAVLFTPLVRFLLKTPFEGAQTNIYTCFESFTKLIPGCYYADCVPTPVTQQAQDELQQKQLFEVSEKITGIKFEF